jgi:hypothetical protein
MMPTNSKWVELQRDGEPMGAVYMSIEVLPAEQAKMHEVGFGRSTPNQTPFLPPPSGRLKFSLNPCTMIRAVVGPEMCFCFICCLLCLFSPCFIIAYELFVVTYTIFISHFGLIHIFPTSFDVVQEAYQNLFGDSGSSASGANITFFNTTTNASISRPR